MRVISTTTPATKSTNPPTRNAVYDWRRYVPPAAAANILQVGCRGECEWVSVSMSMS